ncbi:MAG: pentapeptide repeat-containing protein [Betaproteobacteria bacterium]|nr:pentapeptide repeat-containing protein [Betaproteobacteria bacterium]
MSASDSLQYAHRRLPQSTFTDVDLNASVFDDVNLRAARFENVALTGAVFHNVCLGSVTIDDANLEGLKINGVLVTDLFKVYNQYGPQSAAGTAA